MKNIEVVLFGDEEGIGGLMEGKIARAEIGIVGSNYFLVTKVDDKKVTLIGAGSGRDMADVTRLTLPRALPESDDDYTTGGPQGVIQIPRDKIGEYVEIVKYSTPENEKLTAALRRSGLI